MRARLGKFAMLPLLGIAASASATIMNNSVGPITFDGANDLSGNFRQVPGPFSGATPTANTLSQSSNSPGSNYVAAGFDGSDPTPSSVAIAFYNPLNTSTTPPGSLSQANQFAAPVTVSFLTRSNVANDSIGVFFTDPTQEGSTGSVLALVNWNHGGASTPDELRVWTGCNADTNTLGTNQYSNTSAALGLNVSQDPSNPLLWPGPLYEPLTYQTLSVTYAIGSDSKIDITVTGPGGTIGPIDTGVAPLANAPEIGFRFGPTIEGYDRVDMTDLSITVAPEPASVGLVMGAAALLLRRRRA